MKKVLVVSRALSRMAWLCSFAGVVRQQEDKGLLAVLAWYFRAQLSGKAVSDGHSRLDAGHVFVA